VSNPLAVNPVSFLETGVLYCDDNLARLTEFPADCIDLIYLDPPFFSNRHYEVIWGDEAEVRSFEDRWKGEINVYIDWMRERMHELRRVLKPTGTIYLHCDWHAGHHLKVMMDEIFGTNRFLNEIIWHYKTSSGSPKKWLHRNHDTILRYANGPIDGVIWNHPKEPWPEKTLKKWQKDEDGRIYRAQHKFGKRYYIDITGKLMDDVWEMTLSSRSHERLGYPTQKPEALLERIIVASSNEGDIILDPFCGCGTTVAVAQKKKRQWVGIDISPTAVGLMQRRLRKLGADAQVEGVPVSEVDLRTLKPFEFQNWVMQRVSGTPSPKKSGDMGIDGVSFMYHEPIQVKQSESVGRNVVDNFETAVERSGKDVGYIVAFSFTRGAYEEAARAKAAGKGQIVLITVGELIEASEAMTRPKMPKNAAEKPTPDLMRLLSALTKSVEEQPLLPPRPRNTRPSAERLLESERAGSEVPA
jgi:DNA modification methylase